MIESKYQYGMSYHVIPNIGDIICQVLVKYGTHSENKDRFTKAQ